MGDVNIDTHDRAHPGFEKLMSFCDVFDLTNIVKSKLASPKITAPPLMSFLPIDRDLVRKRLFFEAGLSDYHNLVVITMKSTVLRLKAKQIKYRRYKKFVPEKFLKDVKQAKFECDDRDSNKSYDHLTNTFRNLVEKHAPIKTKFLRGK